MLRDVSKTLNVRVKTVRKTRSGGIAIETMSGSELNKIERNALDLVKLVGEDKNTS